MHGAEAPAATADPGAGHVDRDVPRVVAQFEPCGRGGVSQLPHHEGIADRHTELRVGDEHRRLPHGLGYEQGVLVAAADGGEEAVGARPVRRHRELGVGERGESGGKDVLGVGPVDQLSQPVG